MKPIIDNKIHNSLIIASLIIFFGLAYSSCNNDVFVDRVDDVVDNVTLSGFGGTETIKFQRKGLRGVSFHNNYSSRTTTQYFNHDGNEIQLPTNIDDVEKVTYSSTMFAVEFYLIGDEAKIVVIDNAYSDGMEMFVVLDYGHTEKIITLKIDGGEPHVMTQLGYYIDHPVVGTTEDKGFRENMFNNSDQTVKMEVYPFKDVHSRLRLTPTDEDFWSTSSIGKIQVPNYIGGEWCIYYPTEVEATIGKNTYFTSSSVNYDEKAFVEVPPNSAMRVEVSIIYATLDSEYLATVHLPNFDKLWNVNGKYELQQPIDFKIVTIPLDL